MVASTPSPTVVRLVSRGEVIPEAIDLHNRVESALVATGHLHGRNLRFEVAEDVVVLKGGCAELLPQASGTGSTPRRARGLRLSNELEVARG